MVGFARLGRVARQTHRHEESVRGGGPKAGHHHAPDVGDRHGVPIRQGLHPAYDLRIVPA